MGNNESSPNENGNHTDNSPFQYSKDHFSRDPNYNFDLINFPLTKSGKITPEHMNQAFHKLPDI